MYSNDSVKFNEPGGNLLPSKYPIACSNLLNAKFNRFSMFAIVETNKIIHNNYIFILY